MSGRLSLEEWVALLAAELGIGPGVELEIDRVLDVAKDAAHGVARPAAPLSTFLAGYAAGLDGGGPEAIERFLTATGNLASAQEPGEEPDR